MFKKKVDILTSRPLSGKVTCLLLLRLISFNILCTHILTALRKEAWREFRSR